MNKGKLVRASHGACAAPRPPQRLGSCLLTQRRGVRRREEALQSMCLLPVAPRTIAPPFAIAYRRLATSVSDQMGGREGLEGLGEGDGEGDGGMVGPGDLCDPQVKVG